MTSINFFIAGAPKCGTTALAQYLDEHPQVFISKPKEIHYFADDFGPGLRHATDEASLKACFADVQSCHRAVGEASVWTLYSATAIKNIYSYNPDAKLIIMLRQPVQMMYSLHSQLLITCDETLKNFKAAIDAQEDRKTGKEIPKTCREPKILQYFQAAMFGRQLERVFAVFPKSQVKIIWFDTFIRDTKTSYKDVLSFLNIDDVDKDQFPVVNANKKVKSGFVNHFVRRPPAWIVSAAMALKKTMGFEKWGVMDFLLKKNIMQSNRSPISPDLYNTLLKVFLDDIERLEKLLDIDLHEWKQFK